MKLGNLANMTKDNLKNYVGTDILPQLSRIDVVWYGNKTFYAFEIVISGNMKDALLRLADIGMLNAKLFIVATKERIKEYYENIKRPSLRQIENKCKPLTIGEITKMYITTKMWSETIRNLQLPQIKNE